MVRDSPDIARAIHRGDVWSGWRNPYNQISLEEVGELELEVAAALI
jgi:hypothetical protein